MCSRYKLTTPTGVILDHFDIRQGRPNLAARYNIAPMQAAPVVAVTNGKTSGADWRSARNARGADEISIGGIVSALRPLKTRKGDRMSVFMLGSWFRVARLAREGLLGLRGDDRDLLAAALGERRELHRALDACPQRVVVAQPDVLTRVHTRAALPHEDRAGRDQLAVELLDAQPLRV